MSNVDTNVTVDDVIASVVNDKPAVAEVVAINTAKGTEKPKAKRAVNVTAGVDPAVTAAIKTLVAAGYQVKRPGKRGKAPVDLKVLKRQYFSGDASVQTPHYLRLLQTAGIVERVPAPDADKKTGRGRKPTVWALTGRGRTEKAAFERSQKAK